MSTCPRFNSVNPKIKKHLLTTNELKIYYNLRQKKIIKHTTPSPVDIYYVCIKAKSNGSLHFFYFGEFENVVMLLGSGGYVPEFHSKTEILYEFFPKSIAEHLKNFNPVPKHILSSMHNPTERGGLMECEKYKHSFEIPDFPLEALYCQILTTDESKYYFDQRAAEILTDEKNKVLKFSCIYKTFCNVFYVCDTDAGTGIKFTYFVEYYGNVFIVGTGGYIPIFHKDDQKIPEFFIDSLGNTNLQVCSEEHVEIIKCNLLGQ